MFGIIVKREGMHKLLQTIGIAYYVNNCQDVYVWHGIYYDKFVTEKVIYRYFVYE